MATYPIKMLKDEENKPFVPLVSTDCIRDESNQTLQQLLDKKLSPDNLLGGDYVNITTEGNNCYVNVDLPANLNVINNLTTDSAGQGALDAYQGKMLKDSIPQVVNDLSSTSTTSALSANQGYILNSKFNDYAILNHSHGLLNNELITLLPDSTEDNGWSIINPTYNGFLLKSIRGNHFTPEWYAPNYSSGIAFGGHDTKGVISLSYAPEERITKFAGGNGDGPKWWYGITGNSGNIYNLNYPIGFSSRKTEAYWGPNSGTVITDWSDDSGGDIAFRKNCPNQGQMSVVVDGLFYQSEGRYRCLDTSDLGSYAFYKWPSGSMVLSDSGTTSISKELTITTKGRPVYISVSGDNNPNTDVSWFTIFFYRDNIRMSSQIVESHGLSWNNPFSMQYLDIVDAGTHTYKVEFAIGSGSSNLNEDGAIQSPNFVVFEI